MRVVEVERVAEHGVREGCGMGWEASVQADDCRVRLATDLAEGLATLCRHAETAGREAAAKRVEQMELRRLDNGGRDPFVGELAAEGGQALSCSCHRHTLQSVSVPGKPGAASGA